MAAETILYAEFYLSTRGQCINNRAADEREPDGKGDFVNTYGDWFAFNFGDKDSYYYRGAFMDCVQAIRFMATRTTHRLLHAYSRRRSDHHGQCGDHQGPRGKEQKVVGFYSALLYSFGVLPVLRLKNRQNEGDSEKPRW